MFFSFQGLKDLLNHCVYLAWWEQAVLLSCRITTVYFTLWKGTELWRTPLVLQSPPLASHLDQHWGRDSNLHFMRGSGVKLSFSTTQNLPHFRKPERIISFRKSQQWKLRVLKIHWTGIWSLALSLHHSFAYSLSNESKNKHKKIDASGHL